MVGASGSGKSTLLRCVNGLVPHASGGRFGGDVVVFGRSTRTHHPPRAGRRRRLRRAGSRVAVRRRPRRARPRVRAREPRLLAGGDAPPGRGGARRARHRPPPRPRPVDRCRAASGSGARSRARLAAAPQALVLDEPTSQLDPQGADDVLAALVRLNADLGTTVVLAEHRLERAAPLADRAVLVDGATVGAPARAGRGARRLPGCAERHPARSGAGLGSACRSPCATRGRSRPRSIRPTSPRPTPASGRVPASGDVLLEAAGSASRSAATRWCAAIDLELRAGDVIALFGRNGAGKTTLLRALAGLLDAAQRRRGRRTVRVAYVPQNPNTMLFSPPCAASSRRRLALLGRPDAAAVDHWLDALHLTDLARTHPRSLSGGERQRVAIAAVAVGGAPVLLLDEPTARHGRAVAHRAGARGACARRERWRGRARHPRRRARGAQRDRTRSSSATARSSPTATPAGARRFAVRAAGAARAASVPHRRGSRRGAGRP